jgi:hypothetical protein
MTKRIYKLPEEEVFMKEFDKIYERQKKADSATFFQYLTYFTEIYGCVSDKELRSRLNDKLK